MLHRQLAVIASFLFFTICIYSALKVSHHDTRSTTKQTGQARAVQKPLRQTSLTASHSLDAETTTGTAQSGPQPKKAPDPEQHPIRHLLSSAKRELRDKQRRQSKDLHAAVQEYRRRYGMPPPPNFDKWFQFAKDRGVQLIDEFDIIHDLITPFWGLKPKTIRARAREALGYDNGLIGVAIRNHGISHLEGGMEWQRNATHGMLQSFLQYLPDMDLAFNMHDEPRVVVPHDDLTTLVRKAKDETMPASNQNKRPVNDFSKTSPELSNKMIFEQVQHSRFNSFGRQATWTHSRMSCSPDSPARILEDDEQWDDRSQYGVSELGFVYNATAMTDICFSPSLSSSYGFFDRPNTYKVVHDLFPIFSQSKISSYNDIIYPSPWYWYNKVQYEPEHDVLWDEKASALYWRGSTTGGFSRNGGWRRQHRQHFVKKINDAGRRAKIMMPFNEQQKPQEEKAKAKGEEDEEEVNISSHQASPPTWAAAEVPRADYISLTDVAFSHIGQCDPGDCDAQRAFFNVTDHVNQTQAWHYKYLLDMDGNAFSGRFLAFLQSMSLTFKFALFREWHNEWLAPWVHYVPLSLQGDDWLETVRFFNESSLGAGDAVVMAQESREWAGKAMRKEDMEAWFFRLLLEYARVIDDQRGVIGFDVSSSGTRLG
ncbi:hypothetical protein E4U47_004773 [Claviceps purpurea]|nr:hypothetical protein E4U47_004773 [Claviceps purpurea]